MFKRSLFKGKDYIKGTTQIKSSVQKAFRIKIIEIYPNLEPFIFEIFPKKSQLTLIKCEERISLYVLNNEVLFFQFFENIYPHLKLLHKYPDAFLKVQADKGVIKSILSGANLIKLINKGIGIENIHYLGDNLWNLVLD
ncbi:hypothetical protein PCK1_000279 [Pneumocystis canis]|nr:hypothetical protein PCK1_000279 [Pneumocystis canis]